MKTLLMLAAFLGVVLCAHASAETGKLLKLIQGLVDKKENKNVYRGVIFNDQACITLQTTTSWRGAQMKLIYYPTSDSADVTVAMDFTSWGSIGSCTLPTVFKPDVTYSQAHCVCVPLSAFPSTTADYTFMTKVKKSDGSVVDGTSKTLSITGTGKKALNEDLLKALLDLAEELKDE